MQHSQRENDFPSEIKITESEINHELESLSSRYHITGAWIAIIFDPIFAFTDYINFQDCWHQILIIRLSISAITGALLYYRKRKNIQSYIIVFVPFLLISLQNAYTFTILSEEHIIGHSLNYIALFIGAAMFVLWHWKMSVFVIVVSAAASSIFISMNQYLPIDTFFLKGGLLLITSAIFMIVLINARYRLHKNEIRSRLALRKSKDELAKQNQIIEDKNDKITSSIEYAWRIQHSMLGTESNLKNLLKDAFVLFKPKDIISGDFYWFHHDDEREITFVAAADCTGHGVPAALITVMGNNFLNNIVKHQLISDPCKVLYELDKKLISNFQSKTAEGDEVNDGMDMTFLAIYKDKIHFAGANNPLVLVHDNEVELIKGDRYPIGSSQYDTPKKFTTKIIDKQEGSKLYIFSDGFQDQFGGPQEKKYMTKRFRQYLFNNSQLPMAIQKERLEKELLVWKGDLNQTDDVLIVGLEV